MSVHTHSIHVAVFVKMKCVCVEDSDGLRDRDSSLEYDILGSHPHSPGVGVLQGGKRCSGSALSWIYLCSAPQSRAERFLHLMLMVMTREVEGLLDGGLELEFLQLLEHVESLSWLFWVCVGCEKFRWGPQWCIGWGIWSWRTSPQVFSDL